MYKSLILYFCKMNENILLNSVNVYYKYFPRSISLNNVNTFDMIAENCRNVPRLTLENIPC